jgi:hypothetical protein
LWLLFSIGFEALVLRTSSLIVYTAHLVQSKSRATVSTSKMSLSSSSSGIYCQGVKTLRMSICDEIHKVNEKENNINSAKI